MAIMIPKEYAGINDREVDYWIIDPTNMIVSVMLLQDCVLEIDQTCAEGDTAAAAVLERSGVRLDDIFS